MSCGSVHVSDLDAFVDDCDRLGDPNDPNCHEFIKDFSLSFDTVIDVSLNPFSGDYLESQINLYKEVSGRDLDQKSFEACNVPLNIESANPYNSGDTTFISKHTRAVLSCVLLANLPPHPKILDFGAGWGLSSEMLGYSGAMLVHAVDINGEFLELVKSRSSNRGYKLKTTEAEFTDFETDDKFDLVFFYESLHHGIEVWKVLNNAKKYLNASGKLIFAGEPINDFWPNWGLRLDALSVYCIRKFGWFENGWSLKFLSQVFEMCDLDLNIYHGLGLDNGPIGCATLKNAHQQDSFRPPKPEYLAPPQWQSQNTELLNVNISIQQLLNSRSWRITAPLRKLRKLLGN